jgi:hypothetical protein
MNKSQVTTWIDRLSEFNKPDDFLAIAKESELVPNDRFFNDPTLKPLQEAWAAGHFALGLQHFYDSIEIRLDSDRFPDFHLCIDGKTYEFEFTVAEKPERMIGKEYKERKANPLHLKTYQPERGRQEGPSWIANAVRKKHERHYSNCPHLLVYVMFEASSLNQNIITKLCYQWFNSFSSIWVLWCYKFVLIHKYDTFNEVDAKWYSIGVNPLT